MPIFLKECWKIGKCDRDQLFILKLVSIFPWPAIQKLATVTVFMVVLADFTLVALLNFQLRKQVRVLGESATKALLAAI